MDYILFGHEYQPDLPHAVIFTDVADAIRFLLNRHLIFYRGNDADALAYVIITLEKVILRNKIPKAALHAQFRREFGEELVNEVLGCIKNVNKYHRKSDGKVYALKDIPCRVPEGEPIPSFARQLKAAGRFPHNLGHLQ